jgi:3-deoxy-D-manno-octulosonate 8-phosphate phosphatase (KDO 8-P phosphatase)
LTSNKGELPSICDVHTIVFDFDGVFTNNKVWIDQDGRESICCDRGDGLAFDLIRAFKKTSRDPFPDIFILSKEKNSVVVERAKKLQVDCKYGIDNKLKYIKDFFSQTHPKRQKPFEGLIYIGNDLNDFLVMKSAGYSVAPMDAHPKILGIANLVIPINGGDGFVRAFIEKFLRLHTLKEGEFDEFISNC